MKYFVLNFEKYKEEYERHADVLSPFEVGIPLVDLSDEIIMRVYYYRWYVFCKHIRKTPEGHIITEFYNPVSWAKKYNTINCPAGHHLYEGRWLHNNKYLADYIRFWFKDEEAEPRQYSFWAADSIYNVCKAWGDFSIAEEMYDELKLNYAEWEKTHLRENGMFYQHDGWDGMEYSIGGSGIRPTINSYMCGDARALSKIAARINKETDTHIYDEKFNDLKTKINDVLWDERDCFFKTLLENSVDKLTQVRELIGYVPWYFNIPDDDKSEAWKFLIDSQYFAAPYGPTTAEQINPDFMKQHNHECLWNGPSWPFATAQTLTAMGNFLNNYKQTILKKKDYYNLLHTYANSQFDVNEVGERIPYVDENIDPFTGEWIARKILRNSKNPSGGVDRGADYNHSTFCDLVITGLVGLRPREDNTIEINPMFEEEDLDYLCADGILYHGRSICVCWDKTGMRYHKGKGLRIYIDGKEVAAHNSIGRISLNIECD